MAPQEKVRLWQVKATVAYVVAQNEVSAKPATLERKDIQSKKLVLVWQLSHSFDLTLSSVLFIDENAA